MDEELLKLLANSFGFDPRESSHHFVVDISRGSDRPVRVSEHFTWDERTGSSEVTASSRLDGQIRVILARPKWDAVAEVLRAVFNQQLKKSGRKSGAWRLGPNLVRRELGKELVLLAWAIEDADPALIPAAIANWKGLVPEERWWLYTQTAAATGHGIQDRGRGWRRALRYALTENPVPGGSSLPEFYRRADQGPSWDLFSPPAEDQDRHNPEGNPPA